MKKTMSIIAITAFVCGIAVQSFAGSLETQKNDSGLKFSEMKLKSQASPVAAKGDFAPVKKASLTSVRKVDAKTTVAPLKNNETPKNNKGSGKGKVAGGIIGGVAGGAAGVFIGALAGVGGGASVLEGAFGGAIIGGPIGVVVGVAVGIGAAYVISRLEWKK